MKPKPLPATEENVNEIRHNVIMGDRTREDLKECGCPACLMADMQLAVTAAKRHLNNAHGYPMSKGALDHVGKAMAELEGVNK